MTTEQIEQMEKAQLLDKETLIEIFQEESPVDRQLLLNALSERSKDLKCTKLVNGLVKAFKDEIKAETRANRQQLNNTFFFEPLQKELSCGNWYVEDDGIRVLTMFGERLACYHKIVPVERLFNIETKTEKITLAYERDHKWKYITVDKGLIASSTKIVKLADYGVSVTSETAKSLVQFLNDIENMNNITLKNSTSKFGWHDKEFIPYDTSVVFDDASRFKDLAESLKPSGSYDIWLELCKKVRANKVHYEPQVYMAASFASVLVSKLNMLPFIVNLWGSTGKGKTVALMMAASIWANPAENRYITDSYATQNAFEIRLDILNHLPLLMDDLSKVRDKLNDNFTDLIYLLCSGKGKDRSNVDLGLNKVKTWQNTILSNMERPLATETMKGGAINRILDFEMVDGYIFENGNGVVEILKDNYGYAGMKFVDLIADLDVEYINNLRRDFEQKIKEEAKRQDSVKEEKQILPMSLLLAADKIATDYIFEDGIYLDLPTMVNQLKDVNEVSEGQRAYDTLKDFVLANRSMFPTEMANYNAWGFIKDGYINILPTIFRKLATEQNFSTKAFTSWAKAKNLLSFNDRNMKKIWIGKNQVRFYSVKINPDEKEKMESETDFVEADPQEELPFD